MVKTREELAERLLDSYKEVGGINHIDGANLPSKGAIEDISLQLLHLLFPGFYANHCISSHSVGSEIQKQLGKVQDVLEIEIAKALEFNPPRVIDGKQSDEMFRQQANQITVAFLRELPVVRQILSTDVEAAYDGDPASASFEEIILAYPGLEAIAIQRLAHCLYEEGVALIPRMMTEWAHGRTGIDIHSGAKIGSYFFIDHGTGVVVGETCEIGDRVKIYHGVTLGAKSTKGGQQLRGVKRHPTIEDQVTIYPGATILGGETVIGAGSTVGGNVFLLSSVEPRSLVVYEEGSVSILAKDGHSPEKDSGFQI